MERQTKIVNIKRNRKHGFLSRAKTHDGKLVLKRRRARGRKKMTV
jgi:large subunit ribosomal protein L34